MEKFCPACGAGFHCAAPASGCWCDAMELALSPAIRDRICRQFAGCLCPRCLEDASKGSLKLPARENRRSGSK